MADEGFRTSSVASTLIARVCVIAGGAIGGIVTARALGPTGRGQYFAVVTAATLIAQVLNLGLTSSNVFLGARERATIWPLLVNSVWLSLAAAVFGFALIAAAGPGLSRLLQVPESMLWSIGLLSAGTLLWNLAASLLVACERFAALNSWQTLNAALSLLALVACALLGANSGQFAYAIAFTGVLLAVAACLIVARGTERGGYSFSLGLARVGISFSLRAYGTLVFAYFLQRSGATLVAVASGPAELGPYSIASQVFDVLLVVPGSVSLVLYPSLVRRERHDTWPQVRRTARSTVAIMTLLCLLAAVLAPWLIPALFGARFSAAVVPLWWLLPGVLAYSLSSVLAQYLVVRDYPVSLILAWAGGLVTVLLTGPALTARYGAAGAAAAQSLGAVLVCAVVFGIVRRRTAARPGAQPPAADPSESAVLSNYPLSRDYRERLERLCGGPLRFINVADLRQVSMTALLRGLVSLEASHVLVATEDSAGAALLPVMELLAALTRARTLRSVDADFQMRVFSRCRALGHGAMLAAESLRAAGDFLISRAQVRKLARTPRQPPTASTRGAVVYLNCNLWFGVKAGGSVGHISGVANALMDRGLALTLFAAGGRLLVDERARYVPLRAPRILAVPLETTYYRFNHHCFAQIRAELRRSPVEFIYQRLSLGNFCGVQLSRELGIPLVLEYNGSESWVAKNWGRALRFHDTAALVEAVCIQHAHLIVTVSDVLREELLERGVEPERIVTYPNCIDPKTFDPRLFSAAQRHALREGLGFADEDVVATFIGTFGQWHGVDVLARAIARLIAERRAQLDALRLKFLLVGDGQKMPLVRAALAGVDAAPYVRLTGLVPQREAPRYLAASDMLLSPHVANTDGTRFFGSPTKLFEYMAMARGIIASDLDQIGQVLQPAVRFPAAGAGVSQGAVAVLVPPGDEAALMEAMLWLAAQPERRAALGENARRLALERYTWSHHVAAILAGLERVRSLDNPGVLHGAGARA
ncbi:MAG TPA: glycosyltransferase [Steroidobacteraceae bacterium]|jgi:glycosyltransferase involved in cell wall biosynthesis/O-antigen/teichoic acid export membrane protein|nr:glycosyltransferase [Steroidobacteraceae bacterium]